MSAWIEEYHKWWSALADHDQRARAAYMIGLSQHRDGIRFFIQLKMSGYGSFTRDAAIRRLLAAKGQSQ